jgi:hypothetical protein
MTDLVKRLRHSREHTQAPRDTALMMEEAAAEIERLRGVLVETVPDPEYRRMQDKEIERLRSALDASFARQRYLEKRWDEAASEIERLNSMLEIPPGRR